MLICIIHFVCSYIFTCICGQYFLPIFVSVQKEEIRIRALAKTRSSEKLAGLGAVVGPVLHILAADPSLYSLSSYFERTFHPWKSVRQHCSRQYTVVRDLQ